MDRQRRIVYGALAIAATWLGLRVFMARPVPGGPCESKAACYVTPGGSGAANGVDWNNAYGGLPASLACGVTYYLAGGSYDYTSTSTTISNACAVESPLVIDKAVAGGPGNPQNVAGWQASFGNTQALFSQATDADPEKVHNPFFTLSGTHITLDGVVPASGTPTKRAAFGIHLRSLNHLSQGFVSVTGAANAMKHVELDGIANPYGFQVTACSRTNGTVTLTTHGNPPWVVGDTIDLYMNGGMPRDFSTISPSTGWRIASIRGDQIRYAQAGPDETCTLPPAPNPATVVLNLHPTPAVVVNVSANPSNLYFTDNYIHDIPDGIHSTDQGCNHCTFLRNYVARNHSTPTEHANAIDGSVLNNSAIGQNIFEDIEGTSITVPTCGKYCDWQNDAIYSNLVFCTVASQSAYIGPPTGATWQSPQCGASSIFSDDNGANHVTNLLIYGNTIVRPGVACSIYVLNAASTATAVNNFLYCPNTDGAVGSVKIITGGGSPNQHSYNTGWGAAINQAPKPGTGDYFTNTFPAATQVFVDPSDAGEDFRLLNDAVDAGRATGCNPGKNCLRDGTTLPPPYNVDLFGTPRGVGEPWMRGAFASPPANRRAAGVNYTRGHK